MGKRYLKNIILVMLITLSMWQTSKLWLGNMPSLSFFEQPLENNLKQIEPESIWLVPGAPGTMVYRLGEENREYQVVREEIEDSIKSYIKSSKAKEDKELAWKEIFEKKGILYQYPLPLTYEEVVGENLSSTPKDKSSISDIDYIFIPLADNYRGITKWELISTSQNKMITIEIQEAFENIRAFSDLLNDGALANKVKYQPTFSMLGFDNRNIFLPISSTDMPIAYDILEWYNPLENQDDINKFNPHINHYFLNPLLKKEEVTSSGVHIFSELMEAVVKYYPSGVFEYSNIAAQKNSGRVSRLEAYNISQKFLNKNESLSKEIKNTLFLSDVEEIKTGYIFSYDMRIGGVKVYLSEEERERLGMDHMVQVKVEGREVSKFRWNANELRVKNKTGYFKTKYTEAINKVLEYVARKNELNTLVIDDMKWVYMVNGPGEDVDIRWIILHDNKWYSP